jgi:hypothetical protein
MVSAGEAGQGQVVVTNETGAPISATGCGSFFQVALVSSTYTPEIFWNACGERLTIPVGVSSYPVTVAARWLGCTNDPPNVSASATSTFPPCADERAPGLPRRV